MPDIVRIKVQPQCWSSHTSGHQQEAGLEQTQEQEGGENIMSGGQRLVELHLQEQVSLWKVAMPGQESPGSLHSQPQEVSSSTTTTVSSQERSCWYTTPTVTFLGAARQSRLWRVRTED